MGDHTIEDANLVNDKLCEAVEENELRHRGGIESRRVSLDGCGRRNVRCKGISQQQSSRTTFGWSKNWSHKKSELK